MAQGIVKWFNDPKGFGFIQPDPPAAEVFWVRTPTEREHLGGIQAGDRVAYELDQRFTHGPRARNVRKLDLTPSAE